MGRPAAPWLASWGRCAFLTWAQRAPRRTHRRDHYARAPAPALGACVVPDPAAMPPVCWAAELLARNRAGGQLAASSTLINMLSTLCSRHCALDSRPGSRISPPSRPARPAPMTSSLLVSARIGVFFSRCQRCRRCLVCSLQPASGERPRWALGGARQHRLDCVFFFSRSTPQAPPLRPVIVSLVVVETNGSAREIARHSSRPAIRPSVVSGRTLWNSSRTDSRVRLDDATARDSVTPDSVAWPLDAVTVGPRSRG